MKNLKQWMTEKLLKWSKTLNIEQALRDAYHKGCEATEKKYAGKINVWWDPTVRSYPQQEPKSAMYEPPPPRTDQVQVLHLRTGEWSRQWREAHGMKPKQEVVRTSTEPLDPTKDFPKWLTGEDDPTLEVPAIKKRAYQEYQKRHAG